MLRCKDLGESFFETVYNHLHDVICEKKDYTLLLLLDQLLRQFKYFKKFMKDDAEKLFQNVFSESWKKENNGRAIRDLQVVWKIWTFIFGNRIKNLKANIYNKHKFEIDKLSPDDEAAIKLIMKKIDPTSSNTQAKQSTILSAFQSDSDDSI